MKTRMVKASLSEVKVSQSQIFSYNHDCYKEDILQTFQILSLQSLQSPVQKRKQLEPSSLLCIEMRVMSTKARKRRRYG